MKKIRAVVENLLEDIDKIEIAMYQILVEMYEKSFDYEENGGYLTEDVVPGMDTYTVCDDETTDIIVQINSAIGGYPQLGKKTTETVLTEIREIIADARYTPLNLFVEMPFLHEIQKELLEQALTLNELLDEPFERLQKIKEAREKPVITIKEFQLLYGLSPKAQEKLRCKNDDPMPYVQYAEKGNVYYNVADIEKWRENYQITRLY